MAIKTSISIYISTSVIVPFSYKFNLSPSLTFESRSSSPHFSHPENSTLLDRSINTYVSFRPTLRVPFSGTAAHDCAPEIVACAPSWTSHKCLIDANREIALRNTRPPPWTLTDFTTASIRAPASHVRIHSRACGLFAFFSCAAVHKLPVTLSVGGMNVAFSLGFFFCLIVYGLLIRNEWKRIGGAWIINTINNNKIFMNSFFFFFFFFNKYDSEWVFSKITKKCAWNVSTSCFHDVQYFLGENY